MALDSSLRAVHTLLDSGSLAKAPILAQQVGSFAVLDSIPEDIRGGLMNLSLALQNFDPVGDAPSAPQAQHILLSVAIEYERVVSLLRSNPAYSTLGFSLPTLRPKNYMRNIFHVFNALFAVSMYEFFLTYGQCILCSFLCLAWYASMDILRRFFPQVQTTLFDRLFASITRPRERFTIPAATWYCLSMLLVLLCAQKTIAEVSVLVLGVGDPAATLIGRSFRSRKIYEQKSIAGFMGFVSVSFGTVLLFLVSVRPEMTLVSVAAMAFIAGVIGATAELFSNDRVDDNLTVPIAVALALSLLF